MSLPERVQRSSDIASNTEVDVEDSSAARISPNEQCGHHITPRDSKTVDGAMLAKMTQEVLERQSNSGRAPVGKFYRTCGQQNDTTAVAAQTQNRLLSNFEPKLASRKPEVGVAVSERPTEWRALLGESKQRLLRSSNFRRSSSDEVDKRRRTRLEFGQVLVRQRSDPSERRSSPPPRMLPIQSSELSRVPASNGRLVFPEAPPSSSSLSSFNLKQTEPVSYTHLTLPTIYSV